MDLNEEMLDVSDDVPVDPEVYEIGREMGLTDEQVDQQRVDYLADRERESQLIRETEREAAIAQARALTRAARESPNQLTAVEGNAEYNHLLTQADIQRYVGLQEDRRTARMEFIQLMRGLLDIHNFTMPRAINSTPDNSGELPLFEPPLGLTLEEEPNRRRYRRPLFGDGLPRSPQPSDYGSDDDFDPASPPRQPQQSFQEGAPGRVGRQNSNQRIQPGRRRLDDDLDETIRTPPRRPRCPPCPNAPARGGNAGPDPRYMASPRRLGDEYEDLDERSPPRRCQPQYQGGTPPRRRNASPNARNMPDRRRLDNYYDDDVDQGSPPRQPQQNVQGGAPPRVARVIPVQRVQPGRRRLDNDYINEVDQGSPPRQPQQILHGGAPPRVARVLPIQRVQPGRQRLDENYDELDNDNRYPPRPPGCPPCPPCPPFPDSPGRGRNDFRSPPRRQAGRGRSPRRWDNDFDDELMHRTLSPRRRTPDAPRRLNNTMPRTPPHRQVARQLNYSNEDEPNEQQNPQRRQLGDDYYEMPAFLHIDDVCRFAREAGCIL